MPQLAVIYYEIMFYGKFYHAIPGVLLQLFADFKKAFYSVPCPPYQGKLFKTLIAYIMESPIQLQEDLQPNQADDMTSHVPQHQIQIKSCDT